MEAILTPNSSKATQEFLAQGQELKRDLRTLEQHLKFCHLIKYNQVMFVILSQNKTCYLLPLCSTALFALLLYEFQYVDVGVRETQGACTPTFQLLGKVPHCSLKRCQFLFMRVPLNKCAPHFLNASYIPA